jgi:hypothetical protein
MWAIFAFGAAVPFSTLTISERRLDTFSRTKGLSTRARRLRPMRRFWGWNIWILMPHRTLTNTTVGPAGQPGDLGVLRGVAEGVAEEARTRGFASPALAGFAFIEASMRHGEMPSILGFT